MPMLDKIKYLSDEILSGKVTSEEELESFRLKYLSKKGLISELFEDFRNVPAEVKKRLDRSLMN